MVDNARAVCANIYKRAVQPASRSTYVVGRFTSLGCCILICLDVVHMGSAKSELRCDGYDVCGEPCLASGTNPLRCGPPLNVEMSARIFRCLRNARLRKQFNFPAIVPDALVAKIFTMYDRDHTSTGAWMIQIGHVKYPLMVGRCSQVAALSKRNIFIPVQNPRIRLLRALSLVGITPNAYPNTLLCIISRNAIFYL